MLVWQVTALQSVGMDLEDMIKSAALYKMTKMEFSIFFQIFWGLVAGFVSLVHGIVSWVLGLVFCVSGLVFWVSGFVFWVSGFVFWVSGLVFWVSGLVFWVSGNWNCLWMNFCYV